MVQTPKSGHSWLVSQMLENLDLNLNMNEPLVARSFITDTSCKHRHYFSIHW